MPVTKDLSFCGVRLEVLGGGSNPPEAYLQELESLIGAKLPHDYRDFLSLCECRVVTVRHAEAIFSTEDGTEFDVHILFGDDGNGTRDLKYGFERTRGYIAPDLMPIAMDQGAMDICIGIRGERQGAIYVWDRGPLDPGDEGWETQNALFAASSFSEFFKGLTIEEYPEA